MNPRLVYIVPLVFLLCCNSERKRNMPYTAEQQKFGESELAMINSDSIFNGTYIISKFNIAFRDLTPLDISKINLFQTLNIKDFGQADIYEIKLSNNLPESVQKTNFIVVNKRTSKGALLLIDSIIPINIGLNSLIGGMKKVKSKGYLVIYDIHNNRFKEIFNGIDFCSSGLPLSFKGDDCKGYSPNQLNMTIDFNNDSLEIKMSGSLAFYCNGMESGIGEQDRSPISTNPINYTIVFIKENGVYKSDLRDKSNICDLLNK